MKNVSKPSILLSGVLVLLGATLFWGCGKEGSSANPKISVQFGTYTASNRWLRFFIPEAHAALSNGKFCFKRLRFKTDGEQTSADPTQDSDNVDFAPGEVTILTTGNSLGDVVIPAGTYKRVEFDLEKDGPGCTSNKSVQLTNSSGSFSSQDRITIKFEGTFVASESGQVLSLAVQNITNALNQVTSDNDIKTKLEDASVKGSF